MSSAKKAHAICGILASEEPLAGKKALVVGCGSGVEAAVLSTELGADVTGIDISEEFDAEARRRVRLMWGDATSLDFENGSFDLVYCFHVLEHISNPAAALAEMARVLRDDGVCWMGTPNRLRLVGYLGAAATPREKLKWNMDDWCAKLRGRFRNELGAHAGFSRDELGDMLREVFADVEDMTRAYYHALYNSHANLLDALAGSPVGDLLLPSVHFLARKTVASETADGST